MGQNLSNLANKFLKLTYLKQAGKLKVEEAKERGNREELKRPNSSTALTALFFIFFFHFGYELKQKAFNYNITPPFLLGIHLT